MIWLSGIDGTHKGELPNLFRFDDLADFELRIDSELEFPIL